MRNTGWYILYFMIIVTNFSFIVQSVKLSYNIYDLKFSQTDVNEI